MRIRPLGTALVCAVAATALAAPTGTAGATTAQPRARLPIPAQPWSLDLSAPGARALERVSVQGALDTVVADGALGVTARIDTPAGTRTWASGIRRVGSTLPATQLGAFRIASNTKMMIATLVMQEIERGRWSLDTTVDAIEPGLLGDHGSVTLEQLLSHTSGLPDGLLDMIVSHISGPVTWVAFFAAVGEDYRPQEMVDAALESPWLFDPGTNFSYSNAGYVLLGLLLEDANGVPLATLLKDRVFHPAGMPQARFPSEPPLRPGSLVDAAKAPGRWYGLGGLDPDVFWSAGAVAATTRDLDRFTAALVSGRLVSRATFADMATPRSPNGYGLGLLTIPDPCTPPSEPVRYLIGHDGASFGTFSLALGSEDGSRQLSFGVNGRYYTSVDQPYDLNALALRLVLATC